ncbi:Fe-S oxidoreductase, partial [Carbonactinospora thermoautotrophica]
MQLAAIIVSLVFTLVGVVLVVRTAAHIVSVVRAGQPAVGRTDDPGQRFVTMLRETLGHTRMLKWSLVGAAHWFVFVGFGFLFFTLVTAYGQLFDADFALPVIGHWAPYEITTELIAWTTLVSIAILIGV